MDTHHSKVILITGASSGIGACTAKLFAEQGASIAFTYKDNLEGAEETKKEIESKGGKSVFIKADLTQEGDVTKVVEETLRAFGKIDVLVNNAGGYVAGDEWNGSVAVWQKSLTQNLVSVMMLSKQVIPIFEKQQSGVIINIASRHGLSGVYDAISYGASKAGIINITEAYAKLLAPYGRANVVSPSATQAGYWLSAPKEELEETLENRPNHKLVDPMIVAQKIVFLASEETKNITGQNFPIHQ